MVKNPTANPIGMVVPDAGSGSKGYYAINSNVYVTSDDFLDTALDTDWTAGDTSLGTGGGAQPTVGSNFLSMIVPTSTAGTTSIRVRSAITADAHIYNIPFRVAFDVRFSVTAGAGIAPTGGLQAYVGIQDTGDTHIARFEFDLTTAGSSSLASPLINLQTRQGSTAAAFINSAAVNIYSTTITRTATVVTSFMIEATHQGIAFGERIQGGVQPYKLLGYFGTKVPRMDLNYYLNMRIVADGTAGYTQTAGVTMEVDSIRVSQFGPEMKPALPGYGAVAMDGGERTALLTQALPSASGSLVTSGTGTLVGFSTASTATTGVDLYFAAWDASAAGSVIYDFGVGNSASARLLWYQKVSGDNSAGIDLAVPNAGVFPEGGLKFYRGLVVGSATIAATAVGSSALTVFAYYKVS
jgi:hypothetical protein